jgi:hypothetical protein
MKNFDQKYNIILKEQENDRMKGLQQLANYKVDLIKQYLELHHRLHDTLVQMENLCKNPRLLAYYQDIMERIDKPNNDPLNQLEANFELACEMNCEHQFKSDDYVMGYKISPVDVGTVDHPVDI